MILAGEGVLDDVAQQILALLCVAKRWAGQDLIQSVLDADGISQPGFVCLRWSEDRVGLGTYDQELSSTKQV
jgi:hypothetical protein